jgi:hypothetical protein
MGFNFFRVAANSLNTIGTAAPVSALDVKVEWEARSKALKAKLTRPRGVTSFLLTPSGAGPVKLGLVSASDLSSWDTATAVDVPVTRSGTATEVTATVGLSPGSPPAPSNLRLDFKLEATAGGVTKTVLAFQQLFEISPAGTISAKECAIESVLLQSSPSGPAPAVGPPAPRRRFQGLHPLLGLSQTPKLVTISVNAEFVDLTALWWALRTDALGWYLNPALPIPGRQLNLRVLGWTAGGSPMIWFAVVPDDAVNSVAGTEDVVFFRPPPGVNSFLYPATAAGLTDSRHDGAEPAPGKHSTLYLLGRYLLSPIPADRLAAVIASGTVQRTDLLADQAQPAPGFPLEPEPMPWLSGFPECFRPVGLETAFNNAGGGRVLFLPLASGDGTMTTHPYDGAVLPGLRKTLRSALGTLWNVSAVGTSTSTIPDMSNRELWLAGHSAGNLSMWECALSNKADVARIITFDPSPPDRNFQPGIGAITAVAAARKTASKTLDVFAIVSPNLSQHMTPSPPRPYMGLSDGVDRQLRHTGASVTVLPPFAERESYWNPTTVAPSSGVGKTLIQYLLSNWTAAQIGTSAARPADWRFLFFHEQAMSGGTLVPSSTPGAAPSITSFFEQALGAPSPRPPP